MRSTRAKLAAVVLLALGACRGDVAPARPEAASAPPPADLAVAALGADLLVNVASSLVSAIFEGCGLFEALGLGGPDRYTRAKLEEIVAKLDHLDQDMAALSAKVNDLELLVQTMPARQTIKAAYARIVETCYRDRLDAVVANPNLQVEARNRLLLARAYQVVGELVPPELGTIDDGCNIQEQLNLLQGAIVTPDATEGPYLARMAQLARRNGRPFSEVVAYFAWVVGIQRQALAILAQAHHRLGEDGDLATAHVAPMVASLRRQGLELLRAAEAYVGHQGVDAPFDGSALLLADVVVARMEGQTGVATSSILSFQPVQDPAGAVGALRWPHQTPTMAQGALTAEPLDDDLLVGEGLRGYGEPQPVQLLPVDPLGSRNPYPYAVRLQDRSGIEVGLAGEVSLLRHRTTAVRPTSASLAMRIPGAPAPDRVVALQGRNAVTLEPEWTDAAGLAANPHDRKLLGHADGLAAPTSRLRLVPVGDDPRRVSLTVDLPARGLTGVPIEAIDGGAFAARPGLGAAVVELEPAGPAEPERFALRLGPGRWLGMAPPAPLAGGTAEVGVAGEATAPFLFELVRDGDAYQLSYRDSTDGLRRFLYVNEQLVSGADWQVVPRTVQLNLGAVPEAFSVGTPRNVGELASITLWNGRTDLPVSYSIDMNGPFLWFQPTDLFCQAGPTGTEVTLVDCRGIGSSCGFIPIVPPVLTIAAGTTHVMRCRWGWNVELDPLPLLVQ